MIPDPVAAIAYGPTPPSSSTVPGVHHRIWPDPLASTTVEPAPTTGKPPERLVPIKLPSIVAPSLVLQQIPKSVWVLLLTLLPGFPMSKYWMLSVFSAFAALTPNVASAIAD